MPKSEDQRLSVRPMENGNKYVNTALMSVFNIWYWLKTSCLLCWYCASLWSSCLSVTHSAARKISHGLWWSLIQKWNNRRWFYDSLNCSHKTNTPHKSTPHRGAMYLAEPRTQKATGSAVGLWWILSPIKGSGGSSHRSERKASRLLSDRMLSRPTLSSQGAGSSWSRAERLIFTLITSPSCYDASQRLAAN